MVAAGAVLGMLGWAAPAGATHTHVRVLPGGDCVILAGDGGESDVDLSGTGVFAHNPNVDIAPADGRTHPLHVLVHKGAAGDVQRIEVMGDTNPAGGFDPCAGGGATGEYVNP